MNFVRSTGERISPARWYEVSMTTRLREASNIIVLKPDVAAVFPNGEAVNKALQSLIAVARATTSLKKRPSVRDNKVGLPSLVFQIVR